MNKILATVVCLFLAVGAFADSQTFTGSLGGSNWSVTVSYTTNSSGGVDFTGSATMSGAVIAGFEIFRATSEVTPDRDHVAVFENTSSFTSAQTGLPAPDSTHPHLYLEIFGQQDGMQNNNYQIYDVTPSVQFKITFLLPANTTEHVVSYKFMQNGEQVGGDSQSPRDPARSVTLSGLATNDPVTVFEYQQLYNLVFIDGIGHQVPTGESNVRQIGSGIPTLAGSTGETHGGGPGPSTPPVVNTPPVVPNTPPLVPNPPTPNPPPVDHNPHPNIPSGGSGATTQDIQQQTNDIIDGLNKLIDNEHGNAVSVVAGVNDLKASGTQNANAIVSAVNGTTTATNNAVKGIGMTNGYLSDISRKLSGGAGSGSGGEDLGADQGAAAAAASSAPSYAGPQVGGSLGTGAAVTITTHDSSLPTITRRIGDTDFVIGAFPDWMDGFMAILRAGRPLFLLAMCVAFVHTCSGTVETYIVGLSNAGTGGMSTVTGALDAVPGASLAKHLASSTAVVAVILAAAAAVIALVDVVGSRFGLTLSNLLSAVDLTALGPGIGWLDNFFPVGAAISFSILGAAMPYLSAPLYLAATTTARFLHL